MMISAWFSGINILLILGLLYVYGRSLARTRSGFTLGLALFAFLFLVHNAVAFYFHFTMMPLYADSMDEYMLAFSVLQTAAFAVMNWITWK